MLNKIEHRDQRLMFILTIPSILYQLNDKLFYSYRKIAKEESNLLIHISILRLKLAYVFLKLRMFKNYQG